MSTILNLIIFVLILSVIVIVHELGHLIAAKRFGVYCKEFSIGMGPLVWQKQGKETAWSIRALPIGGFVAMVGEGDDEDTDDDLDVPFERTINGIKKWKQIVVMAAGAIMNILLAWAIFIGITAYQGAVAEPSKPIIDQIVENSVAQENDFQNGDEIIKVESGKESIKPTESMDIIEFLQYYPGETTFTLLRGSEEIKITVTPKMDESDHTYKVGIGFKPGEVRSLNFLESIPVGTEKMVDSVSSILGALGKLIQGVGLQNLSGPVGIYQVTSQIAQEGFISILALVGLLSVNIGIVNLLPIPIMDGGRIFIILIETLIGRKLNTKIQSVVMMIGVLIVVGIMVFATWNDLVRLF